MAPTIEEEVQRIAAENNTFKEATVTKNIVAPILKALGWNLHGSEVEYQWPICRKKADIALIKEGKSKRKCAAIIEVKASRKTLDSHLDQLAWYATHEKADIFVLTNGMEWRFYLRPGSSQIDAAKLGEYELVQFWLDDCPYEFAANQLSQFLSKENTYQGLSRGFASNQLKAKKDAMKVHDAFPSILAKLFNEPDKELLSYFSKQVASRTGITPPDQHLVEILKLGIESFEGSYDYFEGLLSELLYRGIHHTHIDPSIDFVTDPRFVELPSEGFEARRESKEVLPTGTKKKGKGKIPVTWRLQDETFTSKSKSAFSNDLLGVLFTRHSGEFSKLEGITYRLYISDSPQDLSKAKQILSSDYYLNKDWVSEAMIIGAYHLIDSLELPRDVLAIKYAEGVIGTGDVFLSDSPDTITYDPTAKPVSFELFDKQYATKTSARIMQTVYENIYLLFASKFPMILTELWNNRQVISKEQSVIEGFWLPRQIADSEYYFNQGSIKFNKNPGRDDWLYRTIASTFGYADNEFEYRFEK